MDMYYYQSRNLTIATLLTFSFRVVHVETCLRFGLCERFPIAPYSLSAVGLLISVAIWA